MPRFQGYFVAAYVIVGVIIVGYAWSLWVRGRNNGP